MVHIDEDDPEYVRTYLSHEQELAEFDRGSPLTDWEEDLKQLHPFEWRVLRMVLLQQYFAGRDVDPDEFQLPTLCFIRYYVNLGEYLGASDAAEFLAQLDVRMLYFEWDRDMFVFLARDTLHHLPFCAFEEYHPAVSCLVEAVKRGEPLVAGFPQQNSWRVIASHENNVNSPDFHLLQWVRVYQGGVGRYYNYSNHNANVADRGMTTGHVPWYHVDRNHIRTCRIRPLEPTSLHLGVRVQMYLHDPGEPTVMNHHYEHVVSRAQPVDLFTVKQAHLLQRFSIKDIHAEAEQLLWRRYQTALESVLISDVSQLVVSYLQHSLSGSLMFYLTE